MAACIRHLLQVLNTISKPFTSRRQISSYHSYICLIRNTRTVCYLTVRYTSSSSRSYKETVLLPKTKFPQQVSSAKRVQRDIEIEERTGFSSLYSWQWENNKGELYILHDGPPYANGKVHIGHAVNKILKDITTRYKVLEGYKVHYVPGWDCHGLPIELKALTKEENEDSELSPFEICKKAHYFASEALEDQLSSFKRWGVLADWTKYYATYHPEYVIQQLQLFYALYEKGLIYQDYMPVYWSPSNRTALAEAELEYNVSHISTSLYVKFPMKQIPDILKSVTKAHDRVYSLVWTTTPWTLPANQAICYGKEISYCLVRCAKTEELYIIAWETLSHLEHLFDTKFSILQTFEGKCLQGAQYCHPLYPKEYFPVVDSRYVSVEKGTGLVHMAPNHGLEDFYVAKEHNIQLKDCIVNEKGCYTQEARDQLSGKNVLTEGNTAVQKMLADYIVHVEDYKHSYPYDWRSKQPVIFRATMQWFINIDKIRDQAMVCLDEVQFLPPTFKQLMQNHLVTRPPWCISRQRAWGVPIPVFYQGQQKKPVITRHIVNRYCELIASHGPECWWSLSQDQLLTEKVLQQSNLPLDGEYQKGKDVLDIWFDSGTSWHAVLPKPQVADMYLEGVDQARGWFQSSFLLSVALRGKAPYKSIFTHGFVLDEHGRKMSKSLGNVIDPDTITDGHKVKKSDPALGVDVLRWWVAKHASHHENTLVGFHIIEECANTVNKVRNTVRFLLGALHNYDHDCHALPLERMDPLDRYFLHCLHGFTKKVTTAYQTFQYSTVANSISNFVTNEMSADYLHLIKDRLYCDEINSQSRRSCQTAIYHALDIVTRCIAPIMPHLAEEVFLYHPQLDLAKNGVFKTGCITNNNSWVDESLADTFQLAKEVQHVVNKAATNIENTNTRSMDAVVHTTGSRLLKHLQVLQPDPKSTDSGLCELLQVSCVSLTDSPLQNVNNTMIHHGIAKLHCSGIEEIPFSVILFPAALNLCPRCRRYTSQISNHPCQKCQSVLESLEATKVPCL